MPLTAQQTADVRRFAGYPSVGLDHPTDDSRDFAYSFVSPGIWETLTHRLNNMAPEDENTLVNVYLTNLYTLETGIVGAAANLDTEQAAVWKRNRNEVRERTKLFDDWRRRMCFFIGIPPGPSLGSGQGIRLRRS
jgi:hypothetical protein